MAKPRLTDESFKDLLFKELNSGNTQAHLKTNFYFQVTKENYSLDKTRCLKLHDLYYTEWVKLREDAQKKAIENNRQQNIETNSVKIELMSKTLLDLINKVSIVEEKAYDMQLGKVVVYNREPSPMEIIEAIKEYNRINGL